MINILDEMAKIVTQASTALSSSIIYQHKKNGILQEISTVLAVREPLENYQIDGIFISSGRKFIVSKNADGNFLKLAAKMNDVVMEDGVSWFVATTFLSDVDLIIICSNKAFTLTTSKVQF